MAASCVRVRVISFLVHQHISDLSNLRWRANVRNLSTRPSSYSISSKPAEEDSQKVYNFDIVIVGAGIVGAASARELLMRHPTLNICVLEKETTIGAHQSGHNSGVIHAGVYYKPGSLRAKLCVEGSALAYEYFDKYHIPYNKCGKLIVATDEAECLRLKDLYLRGKKNKVKDLRLIDAKGIKRVEPHCQGLLAVWCPHTGIVDWQGVTVSYICDFRKRGGDLVRRFKVTSFRETKDASGDGADYPVTISSDTQSVRAKFVLTCGGLHSDQLAVMSGGKRAPRIVPIRGEYLLLNPKKRHLVKGNIYPVPDPRFPFLGVHFTPRMDGSLWLGPNSVLALGREGYSWGHINIIDVLQALTFPGFYKLVFKHFGYGVGELLKSAFLSKQLKDLQKFIPDITVEDLSRGPAGVRAQALDNNGVLVEDFVFDNGCGPMSKRILHVRNAPSPAATSSLAIARVIADRVKKDMDKNK